MKKKLFAHALDFILKSLSFLVNQTNKKLNLELFSIDPICLYLFYLVLAQIENENNCQLLNKEKEKLRHLMQLLSEMGGSEFYSILIFFLN